MKKLALSAAAAALLLSSVAFAMAKDGTEGPLKKCRFSALRGGQAGSNPHQSSGVDEGTLSFLKR